MPLSLEQLVRACKGEASVGAPLGRVVHGVFTDTRQSLSDGLFVALAGERFDGHDYLTHAAEAGAMAAVVSREIPGAPLPTVRVKDTLIALGDLGRAVRRKSSARVAAVTGSVGKTTTKEMMALTLGARYNTLKSQANENNEIGAPQTLLRLTPEHQAAVLELGMRAAGEIDYLSRVVEPEAAVITLIGEAHVGRLGSREAIADAKAEIFSGLREKGVAILNHDDPFFPRLASRAPRMVTFGLHNCATVRGEQVEDLGLHGVRFRCVSPQGVAEVELGQGGAHLVCNALAAIAVALEFSIPVEEAADALSAYQPGPGRGLVLGSARLTLIDDAYNASPASVDAALMMMARTPGFSRRVAVLGDMLEMGTFAAEGHRRVGEAAARAGLLRLVCVGEESAETARSARGAGMEPGQILRYPDSVAAAADAMSWIRDADMALVKGSNGMKMRLIVDRLKEEFGLVPAEADLSS